MVPRYQASQVNAADAEAGASLAKTGNALAGVGDKMIAIQARESAQQEALGRAEAITGMNEKLRTEFDRLKTEGDFSKQDTVLGFGKFIRDTENEFLSNAGGSEDNQRRLRERFSGIRSTYLGQAGTLAAEQSRKVIGNAMGNSISGLTANALNNPASLTELIKALDADIDNYGPAMTPEDEITYRAKGRSELAASALEGLVNRGNFRGARELMNETPGLMEMLGPDRQRQINGQITALERSESEAATKGAREREALDQFLGRPSTIQERVALKFGKQERSLPETVSDYETVLKRKLNQDELMQVLKLNPEKAQTTAGKAIQDRQMFVSQFGEKSPQVMAFDEANLSDPTKLSDVAGIRKEFTTQSQDFVKIRDAYNKIEAAASEPSAAGDLAMIFGYMKILDPISAVREGEQASAANAASVPERVRAQYNRALTGERLTDEIRKDFLGQSRKLFSTQARTHLALENQYRDLAKRNSMRPEDIVVDFLGPTRKYATTAEEQPTSGPASDAPKPRFKFGLDGKKIEDGDGKAGTL